MKEQKNIFLYIYDHASKRKWKQLDAKQKKQ